jgi:salicylate hydroxylase
VIGKARLNPESQQKYGSPYYVTHRAHLHQVLHARAVELGADIHLNKKVLKFEVADGGDVAFEDGLVIRPDLTIAADGKCEAHPRKDSTQMTSLPGLKSQARKQLNGSTDRGPVGHGLSAYRATISVDEIKADPELAWIIETSSLNLWSVWPGACFCERGPS